MGDTSGAEGTRPDDRRAALAPRPPDPAPDGTRPAGGPAAGDLGALGLVPDDRVRWRDRRSSRWREGRVVGRERDGSVGVRDARGASRALRPERLEVRGRGPRGGVVWEPVPERAARTEQLGLWDAAPSPGDAGRARRR